MIKLIFVIFSFVSLNLSYAGIKGIDLRIDKFVELNLKSDKPTVYYFLSAWCPCSQGTFDHLNELQSKYKDFNFVGFHSSIAIPKKDALEYFGKFKIEFPIIQDDKVVYADKFKAVKTPHVFVYDKDGKTILFQGGATNSKTVAKADKFYLRDALAAISQGKKPKITNAKALGCYIQR